MYVTKENEIYSKYRKLHDEEFRNFSLYTGS
jgi:hypothetical protein